jgi:hypothetical protein
VSSDFSSVAFFMRAAGVAAVEAEVEEGEEEEEEAEAALPAGSSTPSPTSSRSRMVRMPPCVVSREVEVREEP